MWEVRFFGVDDRGFMFLKDLQSDVFSSETLNLSGSKFIEHFIRIVGHDDEVATKILEIAEKELQVYSAVLKLNGYGGKLKVNHACKIHEDGTKTIYDFFEERINVSDVLEVHENGEIAYSSYQEKISNNKVLLENALADKTKKELLVLLGCDHNWINAYKIYEILKTHFIGEAELKRHDELKYFAHSANSPEAIGVGNARHSVQSHQNPKKIANIDAAYNKLIVLSLDFIIQNA